MKNRNRAVPLPDQKNYEYSSKLAYDIACEELRQITDIEEQCRKSGAACSTNGNKTIITLEYLNQPYQILLAGDEISLTHDTDEVPMRDKLLILHYLTHARGTALTNRITTFREIPEGINYFPTFFKRAIKPLIDFFGKEPGLLITAAEKLGGYAADYGDASVSISAFPHLPITPVIWNESEEFSPTANVLFDSTVSDYLPAYDITVLCESIAWKLVRA
ncbi:DUF3786 domain-containing protein [Chloroflexota bacterium]